MRVCQTKDGKLIEMQSTAREGTLLSNAVNAGYSPGEVVEREITPEEWEVILAAERQRSYDPTLVIKGKLSEIDIKSIRSLREWVASQPGAPQHIKDYEAQAVAERVKLAK